MADNSPTLPHNLTAALVNLAEALSAHQAGYALIGGIATGLRGRLRYTDDVDLLLTVPQLRLPGLLEDLVKRGFTIDVRAVIENFVRHHITAFDYRGVRIDWLKPVLPAYQHVLDRAITEHWHECELRVATAEGLILLKLVASRTQDIADIEALLAANQGTLDLAWIDQEWITMFPTDDPRWQRFLQIVPEFYNRKFNIE